ncbi:MAG: hypothetical protein CMJ58_11415 [Planctomycetaceae bacterium]|nr:hypothetical protein [Planctomycetaceae bacterium]
MPEEAPAKFLEIADGSARLRIPQPLPEAVQSGHFGLTAEGPIVPDQEQLRSIVEYHVQTLAALAIEIDSCVRAEKTGCDPRSGKLTDSARRQAANRALAGRTARDLRITLIGHLRALENVFGLEARRAVDEFARKLAAVELRTRGPVVVQRELF